MVYFVTALGKFSRRRNATESIDLRIVSAILSEANVRAHVLDANMVRALLVSGEANPATDVFCFGGHRNPEVATYLADLAEHIESLGYFVVPSARLLRAHENKGLQGLLSIERGVPFLEQEYYVGMGEGYMDEPLVFKTVDGSGSSGVHLVNSASELERVIRQIARLRARTGQIVRLALLKGAQLVGNRIGADRYKSERPYVRYVLQRFVPDLDCDYRVLVFGQRVYVGRRAVRTNDFRASGSGAIDIPEVDHGLLDIALNTRIALDAPWIALDVVEESGVYSILEFQANGFGLATRELSTFAYERSSDEWRIVDKFDSVEADIAHALLSHLKKRIRS